MRVGLHNQILIGMVAGVVVGLSLWWLGRDGSAPGWMPAALWWLDLCGTTIFLGALRMIIAPLILASIIAGVTSLGDVHELGAIGWRTLAYYAITTSIAVAIGLVLVLAVRPGVQPASQEIRAQREVTLAERRVEFEASSGTAALDAEGRASTDYLVWLASQEGETAASGADAGKFARLAGARERTAGDIFRDDIVRPLLSNPFTALAASPPNALGIILFALLMGIACTVAGPERAGGVISFFHGMNAVMMKITGWLMLISPVAIGCIMAQLVAENGPDIFESLGWYCGTVIGGIGIHVAVLAGIAYMVARVGPLALWRGLREAWMIAFTTRSSAATLPVTIKNVTERLGVSPKVANFSLPVGATMNMDGTALYEGVAVIFLIQIYGGLEGRGDHDDRGRDPGDLHHRGAGLGGRRGGAQRGTGDDGDRGQRGPPADLLHPADLRRGRVSRHVPHLDQRAGGFGGGGGRGSNATPRRSAERGPRVVTVARVRRTVCQASLLLALASFPAVAERDYRIDPEHSDVSFRIRHLVSYVAGRFTEFEGTIRIDREQLTRSRVELVIRAASIDTDSARRDEHLRSDEFFEVTRFPELRFVSHEIRSDGEGGFRVRGEFSMHGVRREITVPVELLGFTEHASLGSRVGFRSEFTLDRTDYGLDWNMPMETGALVLGREVRVEINLEAVASDP